MRFVIITHVNHIQNENRYFAYAPYVNEMNIWLKYVDEALVVAPLLKKEITPIDLPYQHSKIDFRSIPDFNLIGLKNILIAVFRIPIVFWRIFLAMYNADHIHLRCPGNMGLIACFLQVLFPNKIKTAKYAGNWDPKSKQPWSYRLQKWILSNTFLTRNMQVLVYGDWENQTKNIKSFFTATYSDSERKTIKKENLKPLVSFIFTGSLVKGKNSLYAIQLVNELIKEGNNVILNIFGEGLERANLQNYIEENNLDGNVFLHGNQNKEIVKQAYQKSHFVILPSNSEGWPKAIAEGMFWGCVPFATKVSCVPFMLDYGNRGLFLEMKINEDLNKVENLLSNEDDFVVKSELAKKWSQKYTTEVFEIEIERLLKT